MSRIKWTQTKPTEEGWYWVMDPENPACGAIAELSGGLLWYGEHCRNPADSDESDAFLWCGPIERPPIPAELFAEDFA